MVIGANDGGDADMLNEYGESYMQQIKDKQAYMQKFQQLQKQTFRDVESAVNDEIEIMCDLVINAHIEENDDVFFRNMCFIVKY